MLFEITSDIKSQVRRMIQSGSYNAQIDAFAVSLRNLQSIDNSIDLDAMYKAGIGGKELQMIALAHAYRGTDATSSSSYCSSSSTGNIVDFNTFNRSIQS